MEKQSPYRRSLPIKLTAGKILDAESSKISNIRFFEWFWGHSSSIVDMA